MLRILILIIVLGFAFLGAAIGYHNAAEVEFHFLAGQVQISLIVLLVGVFLCAVILTLLICFVRMLGMKTEIRSLRKRVNRSEAELKSLRDLPLRPDALPETGPSSASQLPPPV